MSVTITSHPNTNNMSILHLDHTNTTRLPGVPMEDEGVTVQGQIIQEIDFLNRNITPFTMRKQKPCILYPCTNKDRARLIQRMFMEYAYIYMYSIRNGTDETYDPENYKCGYRYSVDLTNHFLKYLYKTFNHLPDAGILLICDDLALQEQLHVVRFIKPFKALLQIQPPYAYNLPGKGSLLFPVFTRTAQSGLVYYEMHENSPYLKNTTTIEPNVLHEETCAYQLFTRGFGGEHDASVENSVISSYYQTFCKQGYDTRYIDILKEWLHSIC
jgi:hypothetical protein